MQPPLFDAPLPPGHAAAPLPLPATEAVLQALALGGGLRTRTWLLQFLTTLGEPRPDGRRYSGPDVAAALSELARQGLVAEDRSTRAAWAIADAQL
ncbi:MAG TPA: hypothetical protein PLW24_15350, partial [Burkholderiaceae bacterium]|nr:hypothetical protein [Burkholderiaceae bacterium]